MRGSSWGLMHRFGHFDERVLDAELPPGITKRILAFARPYRRLLAVFLALIVLDTGISAANPLLYRAIIDDGILRHDGHIVIVLAFVVAGLAVVGAAESLVQRWISSRIGEGLIFDM